MEGFPVQQEQQDQGQMDSVLVKLQLELQQQLQPAASAAQPDAAGVGQLLIARLSPTAASGAGGGDDVTPQRDDSAATAAATADAATDSMHSELTLRQQSVGSLDDGVIDSLASTAAADASAANAVSDALTHSIASLPPPSPAVDAAGDDAAPAAAQTAAEATATSETPTVAVPADAADAAAGAAEATPTGLPAPTPTGLSPLSASRGGSERCLSVTDDEWHMVSRGSSVKAASSTGRYSFEDPEAAAAAMAAMAAAAAAGAVDRAPTPLGFTPTATGVTTPMGASGGLSGALSPFEGGLTDPGSECGSDVTPRDELAASILGHPVMLAAAAAAAAEGGSSSSATPARAATPPLPAAADGADAGAAAAYGAAAGSSDAAAVAAVASEELVVVEAGEALGLLSGGLASLVGDLRAWLVESLAALVQTGRDSQTACMSRAAAALRSLQLSAKESGGLAAAAAAAAGDWRLLLSSAAAVVCLALWMKSRKEANVLRLMLRRRDHELSKLVMRVVSLQELINQGGHLQPSISRYTRFEGVSATYM